MNRKTPRLCTSARCLIALLFLPLWILLLSSALPVHGAEQTAEIQPLLDKHCIQCHGKEKQKGKVRLDELSTFDPELWQEIYEQLASEEMPPDDEPQPTAEERKALLNHVLALAQEGAPAVTTGFRRLNRREYSNTVRDLLGLRKGTFDPAESVYTDEIDHGFDTNAESLVISNELLLEYMGAADKSLRHALFSPAREKPAPEVMDANIRRMQGTSGNRYVNNHKDHIILRSGGNGKLFANSSSRTIRTPGRYTITVTATGVDRDHYPVKFTPASGPIIMGVGVAPERQAYLSGKAVLLRTFDLKDDEEQTLQFDTWIECHRQMDPLGMALESYDPIGRLRPTYPNKQPVTTYGSYKKQDFADIDELKKIMLTDLRPFARNLTIRIAEYAKGRELHHADYLSVEKIVEASAVDNFRLQDILVRIATSDLMRNQ